MEIIFLEFVFSIGSLELPYRISLYLEEYEALYNHATSNFENNRI